MNITHAMNFSRTRIGGLPCALGVMMAGAFSFGALPRAAATAPPNVVFIITDQQAANALSCRMGDRYLKTPALDQLAARGTFFTRAYAANPLCMPSRNSMFTGRYPHETGVTVNNTRFRIDPKEFPTMGTYFRRAGYQTAYFGKWHLAYARNKPATHGFETLKIGTIDVPTAEEAVKFLSTKHTRPFLLVVSFLNPHNICEVPRGEKLNNGPIGKSPPILQLPPPPVNLAPPLYETDSMARIRAGYHASHQFPVGNYTPSMWQVYRWSYYRLIEKVDADIGKVLNAIKVDGLEDNTLIVFTSDHGECDGAHGMNQKTVLYEESARVPLIMSAPGQQVARTSDNFVNTGIDILPTMLDFAGIACPARLTGRSLRPLVNGEIVSSWRDEVVVEDNMTQGVRVDGILPTAQGRMIRTDRFKYCVYTNGVHRESLVDLQNDPGEMINLARDPAYHGVLLAMRERLRRWGVENHDPLVAAMLADDVKPHPFPVAADSKGSRSGSGAAQGRD